MCTFAKLSVLLLVASLACESTPPPSSPPAHEVEPDTAPKARPQPRPEAPLEVEILAHDVKTGPILTEMTWDPRPNADRMEVRVVASGRPVLRFTAPTSRISAQALAPDGQTLVIGTWHNTTTQVHVWDLSHPSQPRHRYRLDERWVPTSAICFTHDGKQLITDLPKIRFWDLETGALLRTFPDEETQGCHVSPDGRWLAARYHPPVMHTSQPDGSRGYFTGNAHAVVWDLRARKPVGRRVAHVLAGYIQKLSFTPESDALLVETTHTAPNHTLRVSLPLN